MAEIHVLDKHTAELIAAGEVVERPASAVKELCENAIDAKANNITVSIERGGISLIQIQDDGCGIEPEYVQTAFLRHATSKVRTQDDLEAIYTLGFRGEALASVASVARVSLLTKTAEAEYASLYKINAGQEEGLEAAARPVGTTITVTDLFYNTPARMKFLKKDSSEATYVNEIVMHLALSHPEISFKFIRDGKVVFQTPGDNSVLSAAYELLGRDFAKGLTEINLTEGKYSVTGYITQPSACRQSRSMQFFFINGRFVKNRTMMAALEGAFRGSIMQSKFPGCIISLSIPAQLVDVNVHPAKTEVRFARENEVFDIIYSAVKSGLMRNNTVNSYQKQDVMQKSFTEEKEVKTQTAPVINKAIENYFDCLINNAENSNTALASKSEILYTGSETAPVINLAAQTQNISAQRQLNINETKIDVKAFEDKEAYTENKPQTAAKQSELETQSTAEQTVLYKEAAADAVRYVGEIFKTYIVIEYGSNMCLIDKHAAHERILYEKLIKSHDEPQSQLLLEPVAVTLGADEKNALMENADILLSAGIEIEDFGGASVLIRSVACDIEPGDIKSLIEDMAHKMSLNRKDTKADKTLWVFHSIACRGAIKAGDKTHESELLTLAESILNGIVEPYCPHGRPIIIKFTQKELEKQFGRQA